MTTHGLLQVVKASISSLPEHCAPANAFLARLSSTLHICIPSDLGLLSTALGSISILAWLMAQLPQVWKNYKLHSTSGLSVFFLTEWLLGDVSNLIGCLLTRQATWQILLATYYCFVDCALMGQYIWYEALQHGRPLRSVWWPKSKENRPGHNKDIIDGMSISSQSTLNGDSSSVKSKPIDARNTNHLLPGDVRGQFRMPRFSASPSVGSPSSSLSSSLNRTRIPHGLFPDAIAAYGFVRVPRACNRRTGFASPVDT